MAGMGANTPTPQYTQQLAAIPGFDVEKEFSPTLYAQHQAERMSKMSPQEQQFAALIEQLNGRG
jgi:hypothetical protein